MKKRIRKSSAPAWVLALILLCIGFVFGAGISEVLTPPYRFERDACTHVANGAGEAAFICGRVDK